MSDQTVASVSNSTSPIPLASSGTINVPMTSSTFSRATLPISTRNVASLDSAGQRLVRNHSMVQAKSSRQREAWKCGTQPIRLSRVKSLSPLTLIKVRVWNRRLLFVQTVFVKHDKKTSMDTMGSSLTGPPKSSPFQISPISPLLLNGRRTLLSIISTSLTGKRAPLQWSTRSTNTLRSKRQLFTAIFLRPT